MTDDIPRLKLVERAEKWLAGIRERPKMCGGDWHGVEVAILDALDEREFGLAWPHEPPGDIGCRWCTACSKVHRETNGTLYDALTYDGITDEEVIHAKYRAAIDEFLSCDGLYGEWIKHGHCYGCKGSIHPEEDRHCSRGCPTWPCEHADGPTEVARWQAIFHRK